MPILRPSYPDFEANLDDRQVVPQNDQEETAIAYIETALAMLRNAGEALPDLQPVIAQIASFIKQQLTSVLQGGQPVQGPVPPPQQPEESQGPIPPPGM